MKYRGQSRWSSVRRANWRSPRKTSVRFGALAGTLGTTPATLRRAFLQVTGLRPRELAEALRLARFKKMLRAGKSITDALYETGYGSSSRVYERSNAQLGMTPATYRKGGKGMKIGYSIAKSTLGKVLVAATERGVSAVYLGDAEAKLVQELRDEYPRAEIVRRRRFLRALGERNRAARRRQTAAHRVAAGLTSDGLSAPRLARVAAHSAGTTRTYSQVAHALGNPKAVRAVARACATNPVSIVVPCHRVIREDGNLAGYRWGLSRKEQLLAQEKVASR